MILKALSRLAAAAVMASMLLAAFPAQAADAKEKAAAESQEQDSSPALSFTKAKAVISLRGGSLFDLLGRDVADWDVSLTLTVTVSNGSGRDVTLTGGFTELNGGTSDGRTGITVPAHGKAALTLTADGTVADFVKGKSVTEKQALALINGRSVKVKTRTLGIALEAERRVTAGTGYTVERAGFYELTVHGGSADALWYGTDR